MSAQRSERSGGRQGLHRPESPHGSVGALTAKHEGACLRFDPFSGDDTETLLLRDRFVTTRFKHECSYCHFDIVPPGARVRALTEVNREDGKVMTFWFCVRCCLAMATHLSDDGRGLEQRAALAFRRRRRAPR